MEAGSKDVKLGLTVQGLMLVIALAIMLFA